MDFLFLKNRFSSPWFGLILIGLSVFTIYSNIYNNPFAFDDEQRIVENKSIRNLTNYLSPGKLLQPRAVVDLTFALNYRFGKLNVFGYHLVNVMIHTLSGFLVYFLIFVILKQLPEFSTPSNSSISKSSNFSAETISLFSALIFVVHPIQTQAVTYTAQRYASMAAMFYMGSMLFYIYARTAQYRTKEKANNKLNIFGLYTLSIACGMLALLSKENTATLPGAILLVEYMIIGGTRHAWKKKLPWLALAFTLWVLFILLVSGLFSGELGDRNLLEDVSAITKETVTVSRWRYLCTQFNVLVVYIRLLFIPIKQSLDYMYPFKSGLFDGLTPLALIFLLAIMGYGVRSIKKRPVIAFSIFYFLVTLSIESSIIPIRDALFEHRLYLPMFGFGLFVSYQLFHYLSSKQLSALVLSVSIVVSLGTATYLRNKAWQENTTLWADVVSKNPHNYRAYNNLGAALYKRGYTSEAITHYLEAVRIKPDFVDAHNNLGAALLKQGLTVKAIAHYFEAVRVNPEYEKAHYNLGIALAEQGRVDEAIAHYLEAVRIKPDYEEAHNNLGNYLAKQGRVDEAIAHYLEAVRIYPDYGEAHYNLGHALAKQGRIDEAITHYLEAVRIKPDFAEGHNNLGAALYKQGRTLEAIEHYLAALRIKPDFVDVHNNIGVALFQKGNVEEAIEHFQEALRIKPGNVSAKTNLKKVLMIQRQDQ